MALQQLAGSNAQNYMPFNPNDPSVFRRLDGPGPNIGGNPNPLGQPLGTGNLAGILQLPPQRPHFGNFIGLPHGGPYLQQPMPQPDYSGQFEKFGEKLGGFGETLGGYSGQFEKFGEQLGGLGELMTGYQDALGSFNEQIGGMGKQFEAVNNKLDSLEKGIASLQQVQPQQQSYNPYASMMGMFNPYNRFSYGRRFG